MASVSVGFLQNRFILRPSVFGIEAWATKAWLQVVYGAAESAQVQLQAANPWPVGLGAPQSSG
jgi:hypothetical protein